MPVYEYFCAHCNVTQEIRQKVSDPVIKVCPLCQYDGLTKQLPKSFGIQFKGSGFYTNDYQKQDTPCASCPSRCKGQNE